MRNVIKTTNIQSKIQNTVDPRGNYKHVSSPQKEPEMTSLSADIIANNSSTCVK